MSEEVGVENFSFMFTNRTTECSLSQWYLKKIPEVLTRAIREEKEKIEISILFADGMIQVQN